MPAKALGKATRFRYSPAGGQDPYTSSLAVAAPICRVMKSPAALSAAPHSALIAVPPFVALLCRSSRCVEFTVRGDEDQGLCARVPGKAPAHLPRLPVGGRVRAAPQRSITGKRSCEGWRAL